MSMKVHMLDAHLDEFKENLGADSKELSERFNPYHPNPEKIDDFDIAGSLGHK